MNLKKTAILAATIILSPTFLQAADVPDALTVEWKGKESTNQRGLLFREAWFQLVLKSGVEE